ncbi:hypothetical protein DFS33DRAFT_1378027 [Desarmillaria ectypa]|nr:hypothetical protein DFS33DRAFT_1378027 [Desarmillaria ectypa]
MSPVSYWPGLCARDLLIHNTSRSREQEPEALFNYRTELNNLSIQAGFKLDFHDVFEGLQHNGTWTSTALIDGVAHGQGSARSVRPAREEASRQALIFLGRA